MEIYISKGKIKRLPEAQMTFQPATKNKIQIEINYNFIKFRNYFLSRTEQRINKRVD